VQYLAELQISKAAFGLGGNSSVRLLARNTGENVWQPITNEQVLPVQDAAQVKEFKDGQMVIAEITGSNQVQSVQDASKKIVNILQAFRDRKININPPKKKSSSGSNLLIFRAKSCIGVSRN